MNEISKISFLLAMREAEQAQLRAHYHKHRIETGAWRESVGHTFQMAMMPKATPLAEQEILNNEVDAMYANISIAENHIESAKAHLSNIMKNSQV